MPECGKMQLQSSLQNFFSGGGGACPRTPLAKLRASGARAERLRRSDFLDKMHRSDFRPGSGPDMLRACGARGERLRRSLYVTISSCWPPHFKIASYAYAQFLEIS